MSTHASLEQLQGPSEDTIQHRKRLIALDLHPHSRLFRKKPVVIEAVQWLGDLKVIELLMGDEAPLTDVNGSLYIETLEGVMEAKMNDWIIKGVSGEFYPCKPDIFEKTYEEVKENSDV